MRFFSQLLQIVINLLRKVLKNQREILRNQKESLRREERIWEELRVIRKTQVQQGDLLNTILEEVTPPRPGVAVKLEFVFGELMSEEV